MLTEAESDLVTPLPTVGVPHGPKGLRGILRPFTPCLQLALQPPALPPHAGHLAPVIRTFMHQQSSSLCTSEHAVLSPALACLVFQCPGLAGTKYHRLGSFKQQKFILWRPEVQNQAVPRVALALRSPEENLFLASCSFWELQLPRLLVTSIQSLPPPLHGRLLSSAFSLCLSLVRTLGIAFRTLPVNSGHLEILNLATSAKNLSKVTFRASRDLMWA